MPQAVRPAHGYRAEDRRGDAPSQTLALMSPSPRRPALGRV
jgi:hypothetical protein